MGEQNWQMFLFLAGLIAAWSGLILMVAKAMMKRKEDETDKRFASLGEVSKDVTALRVELLKLQAALPLEYVRREDFVRQTVTIDAKLDRLAEKLDAIAKNERFR